MNWEQLLCRHRLPVETENLFPVSTVELTIRFIQWVE